jgi:hypothetical protein
MLPIAIALGAGKGLAGAISAHDRGHHNKRMIKQAYRRGDAQLRLRQGDVRQQTNESLAARGLLNAGSAPDAAKAMPTFDAGQAKKGGLLSFAKAVGQYGTESRTTEMGNQASRNGVGLAGTLAAGISGDLSTEFYKERDDLWTQQRNALDENSAATRAGYIGAVGDGISTAAAAQNAFGGGAMPSGIPGAYNIDVVDPLAAFNAAQGAGQTQDLLNGVNYELGIPSSKGR